MNEIKSHLSKLIQYQSVTPDDAGCQEYMIEVLEALGFSVLKFDKAPVKNFFARIGNGNPLLMFAGHTDVVPIGDRSKWLFDPFVLHEENGCFFGRGCADMKGSLASMLVAAKRFLDNHATFTGSLGFLITSGEEGDDFLSGTPFVMEELQKRGIAPQYCVVGEPSSTTRAGDVIKIGRRGSLTMKTILHGKQGHVAYPHLAENPIHKIAPVLHELSSTCWDKGNEHFPPTSFQITHIEAGGQANNIIPGELLLQSNFRYSTEQTAPILQDKVIECFKRHGICADISWQLNGEPFLTNHGNLLEACIEVISALTLSPPTLSTSGGTSDGRFIAPYGVEVIELGPVNATIHQVNEHVASDDLVMLTDIYYELCRKLITIHHNPPCGSDPKR